jgi:hypothetical protein
MNGEQLNSNVPPQSLKDLILTTYNNYDSNSTYANNLISVLKKFHFWPNIKVKKFKNNDELVLLHNNYKMGNVLEYKNLYEECRSIVLDFTLSCNNIVVTYANSIPRRISYDEYVKNLYNETDKYYEAYDGTIITIYYYKDRWYFGTSSCPDANSSKFSHPTKSHGAMFDEVLYKMYSKNPDISADLVGTYEEISLKLREMFVSNLNTEHAYEFVVVHTTAHDEIHRRIGLTAWQRFERALRAGLGTYLGAAKDSAVVVSRSWFERGDFSTENEVLSTTRDLKRGALSLTKICLRAPLKTSHSACSREITSGIEFRGARQPSLQQSTGLSDFTTDGTLAETWSLGISSAKELTLPN